MPNNSTVSFVNMPHQPALDRHIRDRLSELRQIDQSMATYQVKIEARQQHHAMGHLFSIDILRADLDGHANQVAHVAQTDLSTAISTALDLLMTTITQSQGHPPHAGECIDGHIVHLSPANGTGLMDATDGETIGFRRGDVEDDAFADLRVGDRAWWISSEQKGAGRLRCMNRNRQRRTPEPLDTRADPANPIGTPPAGERSV